MSTETITFINFLVHSLVIGAAAWLLVRFVIRGADVPLQPVRHLDAGSFSDDAARPSPHTDSRDLRARLAGEGRAAKKSCHSPFLPRPRHHGI
jgi:hypothetical protein